MEDGSVTKEAVAADKGPEVWYKVQIEDSGIWKPFKEALDRGEGMPSFEKIMETIQETTRGLRENERKALLKDTLCELVETAKELYTVYFCLGADEMVYRPESADTFIDSFFEILREETKKYMQVFREYHEISPEVIVEILNEIAAKHVVKIYV